MLDIHDFVVESLNVLHKTRQCALKCFAQNATGCAQMFWHKIHGVRSNVLRKMRRCALKCFTQNATGCAQMFCTKRDGVRSNVLHKIHGDDFAHRMVRIQLDMCVRVTNAYIVEKVHCSLTALVFRGVMYHKVEDGSQVAKTTHVCDSVRN